MPKRFYPQQNIFIKNKTRHIGRFPSWLKWVLGVIFTGVLMWALSGIEFTPVSQSIHKPQRETIASTTVPAELQMEVEFESVEQIEISTMSDQTTIVSAESAEVVTARSEEILTDSASKPKVVLPTITLLNGCGVKGIGARARAALEKMGFTVIEVRNARSFDYKSSEVLDRSENLKAGKLLSDSLGMARSLAAWDTTRSYSGSDVSLIVGQDYKKLRWKI